jgi:hypothetical protein
MALPYRVAAYINGVLFAPESVSVSATQGETLQFSLTLPAVPGWALLPERSHVVLFYRDPATNSWLLLCEGEYVSRTRNRLATGQRTFQMNCVGLLGYMDRSSIENVTSLVLPDSQATSAEAVAIAASILFNGQSIGAASGDGEGTVKDTSITSLSSIMAAATSSVGVHETFGEIIKLGTAQLPIESFYAIARQVHNKYATVDDKDISRVLSTSIFRALTDDVIISRQLGRSFTVRNMVGMLESLALYSRVPIITPPQWMSGDIILEDLFIPRLVDCIPPSCNVIFNDQITSTMGTMDFLAIPTRVVGQVQGLPGMNLPPLIVATDQDTTLTIEEQKAVLDSLSTTKQPATAYATHALFSQEEMRRGVNTRTVPIAFAKIAQNAAVDSSFKEAVDKVRTAADGTEEGTITDYLNSAIRAAWIDARGDTLVRQVATVFLPYVLVGFPCIVEDGLEPFHGVIRSVVHTLSNTSAPSTTLVISHVRDAWTWDDAVSRTPDIPAYINRAYQPAQVDATYAAMFGRNTDYSRAAATGPVTVTPEYRESDRQTNVDIDALLSRVVRIPVVNRQKETWTGAANPCLADALRADQDAPLAMARFQARSGVPVASYLEFHSLQPSKLPGGLGFFGPAKLNDGTANTTGEDLPTLLYDETASEGHPLFGYPFDMRFTASADEVASVDLVNMRREGSKVLYGGFELLKRAGSQNGSKGDYISRARQSIAKAIQGSLAIGATNDSLEAGVATDRGPTGGFAAQPTTGPALA